MTEQGQWGSRAGYRTQIARFVRLMREQTYQMVMGNRPLFYLGFIDDSRTETLWGGRAGFRQAVDELRRSALDAGLGNPYIAIMEFSPVRARQLAGVLGADAISSYAPHTNERGAPYASLAAYAERFWDTCRSTGAQVIPTVMAGWDRRPRVEHPVPWEASRQKPGVGLEDYYEAPRPEELAAHLGHALDWIGAHPQAAPARAALIYAWNENDEGGWLVPALSEGDARLRAIRKVIGQK
jgi:hypothetical protein